MTLFARCIMCINMTLVMQFSFWTNKKFKGTWHSNEKATRCEQKYLFKKPEKCLKTPIENCNPTTEVALMCITYSWYVDGVMYQEIFQSSEDTSGLCANEKGMFFNFFSRNPPNPNKIF